MRESNDIQLTSRHIFIFLIIAFLLATTIAAVALGSQWELLATATNTATIASPSGMEIITSNGRDELSMLRGCITGQIIKKQVAGTWACDSDSTVAVTGAGAVALDLGNDGVDESTALVRIAVTGDTNSIFTEPIADKLLITVSNAWPTATALAANPTDCAASNFANAIAANGNLTCAQVAFSDLSGSATDAQIPNTITIDLAALATALAANGANCAAGNAPLGVNASGAVEGCWAVEAEAEIGTTATTGSAVNHSILVGSGAGTATWQTLVNCLDSGGNHLNYDAANHTFSCGTTAGYKTIQEEGAGLTARAILNFIGATITCVDNPGSARTDCTISAGGSTNSFETWNTTSGTAPVADSATDTMTLTAGTNISIIGDAEADSITISVTGSVALADAFAINGANCSAGNAPLGVNASGAAEGCFDVEEEAQLGTTNITGNAADDQVLLGTGASAATWTGVTNCTDSAGNHLNYTTASNTFSCGTSTSGFTVAGRSLTASGATVDADAELYTHTKSINILNPTTGETNKVQFYLPTAGTLARVVCSVDTGTLTMQLDKRAEATPNTAGTDLLSATLVCDTDSQVTTSFAVSTIAARIPVNLQITATSGTPTIVRIHVEYTADD